MKMWIYSIVGIIILTVLLDLVLEEGETKKYIKGIISLLAVIVIASPIPQLLKGNFDFGMEGGQIGALVYDKAYLDALNLRRMENFEMTTEARLTANDCKNLDVEGFLDVTATDYKIIKVVVSIKTGIMDEPQNTYNTELIIKIVAEGMRANKEVIIVNV